MKQTRIRDIILLMTITVSLCSCNKQEGNSPSPGNKAASPGIDTTRNQVPSPIPVSPGGVIESESETERGPGLPQPQNADRSAPIGSIPTLRPQQLAEFHPRLPDFQLSKVKEIDQNGEAQSIILFRMREDTARTIKSTVIDVNERASGKLVMEMAQMQKKGQETRVVDGEPITSYYIEIKGMPAIKAYIPSKTVATLYVLVGDHRAVTLREYKAMSPDHLVEVAKTIDFKKFESLSRN